VPTLSKLAIGRARVRFAAVLVSLGVLAGCGGAGTTPPPAPQAAPAQGGAGTMQAVALRPLQAHPFAATSGKAESHPVEVQTYTTQLTPATRQLTPQEMRRIASIGVGINTVTAANSNNLGITTGPDGRLWFCENNNGTTGKIGALSTSGVLSEYTIPTKVYNNVTYSFHPLSITSASGKLWFSSGGAIGSLTTGGLFQPFLFQASGFQIAYEAFSAIVTGSDGNLWTLDYGNPNKIWRITTGGTFTYALLPTSNALQTSSPSMISAPDGYLYFTEYNKNAVMRWSTSGTYSEAIGVAGSNPIGITSGPDGNIWYTSKSTSGTSGYLLNANTGGGYVLPNNPALLATARGFLWYLASGTVTQINTSGAYAPPYNLPAGSATGAGLTTGPDSNLWFTGGGTGGNVVTQFVTQ
jgi:virginiamycin B lyase